MHVPELSPSELLVHVQKRLDAAFFTGKHDRAVVPAMQYQYVKVHCAPQLSLARSQYALSPAYGMVNADGLNDWRTGADTQKRP